MLQWFVGAKYHTHTHVYTCIVYTCIVYTCIKFGQARACMLHLLKGDLCCMLGSRGPVPNWTVIKLCVCVFGSLPGVTWTGPGLVHRQLHAACGNATITNGPLHGWGKTIIAKKSPQKSWTPFFCYPRIHGSWSQYAVLLRYEGSVGEPHGRGRGWQTFMGGLFAQQKIKIGIEGSPGHIFVDQSRRQQDIVFSCDWKWRGGWRRARKVWPPFSLRPPLAWPCRRAPQCSAKRMWWTRSG